MIRVCFFSGDITRSGGTEHVALQLANRLSENSAYNICFLSLTEQEEVPFYSISQKIKRYKLNKKWIKPGLGYIPLIGKLKRFLKEEKIDIIIDIDIVLDVLSLSAVRGTNTKVVSWEHFTADFELSVLYRRMILKYSVKRSDYVVVLTDGDLKDYKEKLGRKTAISRIYNPVSYCLKKEPWYEREKIILTVCRLVPEKGTDYIAKIALNILNKYPQWQWIILGDGPERNKLQQFIAENKLQDRLILKGYVKNVDDYLRKAGIFVLTSKLEGLGLGLLEAKEMMVPCVAFDVKMGPRELIHDNVDGYLINPFDCDEMTKKIEKLINDAELRKRFAENGFSCMDEFHIDKVVHQWEKLLERL